MESIKVLEKFRDEYKRIEDSQQITLFEEDSEAGHNPYDLVASYGSNEIQTLLDWVKKTYRKSSARGMSLNQIKEKADKKFAISYSKGALIGALVVLGFDLNVYDENPLVNTIGK